MNQEEVIARFGVALRKQGYIFLCSELLWRAYTKGLLKDHGTVRCPEVLLQRAREKSPCFFSGQQTRNWTEIVQEAARLPEPTFMRPVEWDIVTAHCGLKGIGSGANTKQRQYQSLYTHVDGSVSELVKIPLHLYSGVHITLDGDGRRFRSRESEIKAQIREIFQPDPYGGWREYACLTCHVIIQLDFFSKGRLRKLRRRIEDQLRKGVQSDIVRVAKSLNMK